VTIPAPTVRCPWCDTDIALEDAKPILYAKLRDVPDSDNMQCRDLIGCQKRQDATDAALDAELRNLGLGFLCRRPA
jgi:hypothetical protein